MLKTVFNLPKNIFRSKNNMVTGFTLIELMVVISIIAVLATVGLTLYGNTQQQARNSKRIQDIKSIGSAYEIAYEYPPGYKPLLDTAFGEGHKPTDPKGGNYNFVEGPDNSASTCNRVKICATLEPAHGSCTADSATCSCYQGKQSAIGC